MSSSWTQIHLSNLKKNITQDELDTALTILFGCNDEKNENEYGDVGILESIPKKNEKEKKEEDEDDDGDDNTNMENNVLPTETTKQPPTNNLILPSTTTTTPSSSSLSNLAGSSIISQRDVFSWVGIGSTIVKQTRSGDTFAFVSFYNYQGARNAIQWINNYQGSDIRLLHLTATLSHNNNNNNNNKKKNHKSKGGSSATTISNHVRLRRQRAPPAPKHPVKKSSK